MCKISTHSKKIPTISPVVNTASLIVIPQKGRPGIEKSFQVLHQKQVKKDGIGVPQVTVLGPL